MVLATADRPITPLLLEAYHKLPEQQDDFLRVLEIGFRLVQEGERGEDFRNWCLVLWREAGVSNPRLERLVDKLPQEGAR